MKRYIEGVDRSQNILFPAALDDYIAEDNAVRVIDAFVDTLDLEALGFNGTRPADTGRPSYHPSVLLKLYIYGYLNRVQSSRRLEREAQRNVELMWLTGRLTPDFKTIADFRKDNGEAIRGVCKQFVFICQRLNMFEGGEVAIDGSKFKAVNNRDKNYTQRKLQARIEQVEESIARYMEELDRADRQPEFSTRLRVAHIKEKIASLQRQIDEFNALGRQLQQAPDQQISQTDPDARSMATSGRGTGMVGYNVQTAVDTSHHLIVAHEVTNIGHDRTQLASMTRHVQQTLGREALTGNCGPRLLQQCGDPGMRRARSKTACSQTHDVKQPRPRPVRQTGLHLPGAKRRIPVPSRRASTMAVPDTGKRHGVR